MASGLEPKTARAEMAVAGARGVTSEMMSKQPRKDVIRNTIFGSILLLTIAVALAGLGLLIGKNLVDGASRLNLDLITHNNSSNPEEAGLRNGLIGTLWIMFFVVVMLVPLGVGAAIFLEEYGNRSSRLIRLIEVNIQNLAAVPSIIYGLLGLAFIARAPLDLGYVVITASMTLTLLVLPVVILASREAIRAVPASIREGSMALGATKWQTIRRQVLPASVPGIVTGVILALSRAIGETAPLIPLGAATFLTFTPGPFTEFTAMPITVFTWVKQPQPEFQTLAAAGVLFMIAVLVVMNSFAIWLRNRYEQSW